MYNARKLSDLLNPRVSKYNGSDEVSKIDCCKYDSRQTTMPVQPLVILNWKIGT